MTSARMLGPVALLAGCLGVSNAGSTTGGLACTLSCGAGATCTLVAGEPTCRCKIGGYVPCPDEDRGTACVDLVLDNDNCGTCGTVCSAGESCLGGACECHLTSIEIPDAGVFCGGTPNCDLCTPDRPDLACCNSTCVDIQTDPRNCGGCGNFCTEYGHCDNGMCQCPPGLFACRSDAGFGIECLDDRLDIDCADCDNVCDSGVCVTNDAGDGTCE